MFSSQVIFDLHRKAVLEVVSTFDGQLALHSRIAELQEMWNTAVAREEDCAWESRHRLSEWNRDNYMNKK